MIDEESKVHYVHNDAATNAVCGETARNVPDNPRFTTQPGLVTCQECRWRTARMDPLTTTEIGILLGSPITPALLDVVRERGSHAHRGWTAEHDAQHGYRHLVHLAGKYLQQFFGWAPVYPHQPPGDTGKVRAYLVKAASLLLAAIEVIDNTAPKAEGDH